jgi:hypothetical protein
MPWLRILVSVAVTTGLACEDRPRYWMASVSCACTQVDGGPARTSYVAVDVCDVDAPDCIPSQAKCAKLFADADCNDTPTASACMFDPGWDYCDSAGSPSPGAVLTRWR